MMRQHEHETDFCIVEGNADLVADLLVRRLHRLASEMESEVNRLYRGREAYALAGAAERDIEQVAERLRYMTQTLREVQAARAPRPYLVAAE